MEEARDGDSGGVEVASGAAENALISLTDTNSPSVVKGVAPGSFGETMTARDVGRTVQQSVLNAACC
jgi:hypothetical protein